MIDCSRLDRLALALGDERFERAIVDLIEREMIQEWRDKSKVSDHLVDRGDVPVLLDVAERGLTEGAAGHPAVGANLLQLLANLQAPAL